MCADLQQCRFKTTQNCMPTAKFFSLLLVISLCVLTCKNASAQNNGAGTSKKKQSAASPVSYEKYIDDKSDAHLKEYAELVAIQSISSIPSHKPDMEKAAAWIVNKLKAIGMINAQAIPTAGNPVVYGSWEKAPGKPTIIIYAHYDVQPVKDAEWDNPPFTTKVENGKIFGRGTSDDKSGVLLPVWAIEAMLGKDGVLPVNVKFMFDGEEESASPSFRGFLTANKEMLKADFALNADGGQFNDSVPSMEMSLRGGAQLEFSVKTANIDAHSGVFGGKTPNAVVAMSQIIASLFTKEGNVAVAGFLRQCITADCTGKRNAEKSAVRSG